MASEKTSAASHLQQNLNVQQMKAEERLGNVYNIINQSPAVVFLWKNEDGWPVEYVSENVEAVFGYSAADFLSGSIAYGSLIHPDDIERIIRKMSAYSEKKDENLVTQEYRIIAKDGSVIWLDHRTLIQRDENGTIIRYQGIVLDISQRKQAEEKLQQSEKKYRSMLESMSDPVYICSQDFRVEYMNPAMIKRTGRDATGEFCYRALHDLSNRCPWCTVNGNKHNDYFESEVTSPKDDCTYHVSHSPVAHHDGSVSRMVVLRNITEVKKLEEQLAQAQKMESIGTLAGGIAHDFNNILTIINGYAQMLEMMAEDDSKLKHTAQQIIKAGDRAANLTRQILGFSRKQPILPVEVDINKLLVNMEKMMGRLIDEDISLKVSLDNNVDAIYADPGQLEQIVINLVANARDAVREQPEIAERIIKVSTSQVFLEEEYAKVHPETTPGWYLQLQVEDTGCGMTKEVRNRIFEPFYTTKDIGKGTGMGLATVFGIVKQNNGNINVYSEPGQGTIFKVYWPIMIKEATQKVNEEPQETLCGGSETILLAEDDDQIREITSLQLSRAGYTVIEAVNGKDALEQAKKYQDKIDLLFTDMVMPIMGGWKLYEAIKDLYPGIPVLFGSGYADLNISQEIKNLQNGHIINKPYNFKEIMARIRKLLANREI